jgi:hypothetical protein
VPDIEMTDMKRNKVYTLIKTNSSAITTSTTIDTSAAFAWSIGLNGMASADQTAVTTLFDSWRIHLVEFTIINNNPTPNTQPIYSVLDYDDSTVLGSVGSATAYDTLMVTQAGQVHKRVLQPRVADAVYSGSVFTNFGQSLPDKWLDLSSASTPHYGVKFYMPFSTAAQGLTVISRIVYQFKNTR